MAIRRTHRAGRRRKSAGRRTRRAGRRTRRAGRRRRRRGGTGAVATLRNLVVPYGFFEGARYFAKRGKGRKGGRSRRRRR